MPLRRLALHADDFQRAAPFEMTVGRAGSVGWIASDEAQQGGGAWRTLCC